MITEEYLKDNFLNAYFIDSERKNIQVETTTKDKKAVFTTIIPYEENGSQYKALSKFMNIDQLHEATYQRNKDMQENFEKSVLKIAEKQGLIFATESKTIDNKFYPKMLDTLFTDIENVDHLFALKLACFERKQVSESLNDEVKKRLRQSKNKLELLKAVIEIIESGK